MKKVLIICNTSYQIFVATWMRMACFSDCIIDIAVSDHMNDSKKLARNIKNTQQFRRVYYINTKKMKIGFLDRSLRVLAPARVLKKYINIADTYDILCVANLNAFTDILFHAIVNDKFYKHRNKDLKIYLMEDGTSTYSRIFKKSFEYYKQANMKNKLRKIFFRQKKWLPDNISEVYVFDKEAMLWTPDATLCEIPKIDPDNILFKNTINSIFDYEKMVDVYDKKYIFMEENFYAEGEQVNDVALLEKIATIVGKENIMVKIHPRNPVNRFKQLGYKTNENTSIPWEVIVLNQNMEDKVLLTVASTSVINPIRLFGQNTKVYSLYKCLDKIPTILAGDLWEITKSMFAKYYPTIEICEEDLKCME